MILVVIWWFASAHKWFKGPKINVVVSTCSTSCFFSISSPAD
ncbi:unnamed protein product, partial [Diplocarpon coronariae]